MIAGARIPDHGNLRSLEQRLNSSVASEGLFRYPSRMDGLRVVFMGTPELACASLHALIHSPGMDVRAVVTQPDRPKGRQLQVQPSPVKQMAVAHGLPVLQPERARSPGFLEELRAFEPQLIAVAAFGQILPQAILDLPEFGCLNVHTSILPRYRGAAPIQWALINGDSETGVTIMKMDAGMDTGAVVACETTPIAASDNAQTLHDRLARIGADLLVRTIPDYVAGRISPRAQPAEGAVHAPKIQKEFGRIDWQLPSSALRNRFRGLTPWPGLFTFFGTPARLLKVWELEVSKASGTPGQVIRADRAGVLVGCGDGSVNLTSLQLEGGRRLSAGEFLAGHPVTHGTVLGQSEKS